MILNKHIILLTCITLIGLFTVSCRKESKCVKGAGKVVTEDRGLVNSFDRIRVEDKINVVLIDGGEHRIEVEAGEKLMPHIITEVNNGELTIKDNNKCNFLRSYKKEITVFVHCEDIRFISYFGAGNVTSQNKLRFQSLEIEMTDGSGTLDLNVDLDSLKIVQHTGPGDAVFSGTSDYFYLFTGGNGWYRMENMVTKDAHINTNGSGDVLVNTTDNLLIELTSLGNIDYYGNPSNLFISRHSGTGEIRKK